MCLAVPFPHISAMDFVLIGIIALVSTALLWSSAKVIASHAIVLTFVIFFLRKCSPQGFKSSHGPIYVPAEKHTWTGSEHQHPTLTHNNGAMLTYFKDNQLLVGQALRIFKEPGPNDMYLKWMRTWPEAPFIRHLSFGNSEVLLVNSLEAHKEVMQTKAYSFAKPAFFEKLMGEIVGKGVLFSVRDEHRLHRRILAGRSHNI